MSAASALARGRTAAEALMQDACTIRRVTGESTGAGGVITPTYGPDLYAGKCRVQTKAETGAATDVGEATVYVGRHEVQLPISVLGLAEGDQVTITASVLDPDLVGKVFTVRDITAKTHLTARRLVVTEVTS
jgi:hypothetical protein